MELDKTTYLDLSIFNREDEYSLFYKLDFTTTAGGREYLRKLFGQPLKDISSIQNRQQMLQYLLENEKAWPKAISNGTIVVVENYLNAEIEPISSSGGLALYLNTIITKTIYAPDFGFIKFSFEQLLNLIRGFRSLTEEIDTETAPANLRMMLERARVLINKDEFHAIVQLSDEGRLTSSEILRYDRAIRKKYKKCCGSSPKSTPSWMPTIAWPRRSSGSACISRSLRKRSNRISPSNNSITSFYHSRWRMM